MTNTRENCPRIGEIEKQIGDLTKELLELVGADEEELEEARQMVYEDYRETDADMVSDLDCIDYILSLREAIEEAEGEAE
jgi:hypothetical protein